MGLLKNLFKVGENSKIDIYRIWDHAYTKDAISRILVNSGFADIRFYENLAGGIYSEKSVKIGIIARKSHAK